MLKLLENFGVRVYFTIFISECTYNLQFYFGVEVYSRMVVSEEVCT
jgi:hypothetical protein